MNVANNVTEMSDLIAKRLVSRTSEGALSSPDESAAWAELSAQVASDPTAASRACVAAALRSCQAATAGLSLLRFDGDGRAVFHWTTVDGLLATHQGVTAPRDASACGLCLDAGTTILVARPERMFTYLNDVQPGIVETLIVPLYDAEKTPLGTLWVAHHDSVSRFGTNDARVMERLALLLTPALQGLATPAEHPSVMRFPEPYREALKTIIRELLEERGRRERAEASEKEIRQISHVEVQDAHHRTKNTLQMAANLLRLQSHATQSVQVRTALDEVYLRLNLLARVHETLSKRPGDSDEISMPDLLRTLADALRNAFPQKASRVSLEVKVDPISLAVEQAIALGLFANEALTNAYKHAFPEGVGGTITLGLRCVTGNSWSLHITDNGVGMGASGANEGLGSRLIQAFAAQLRATLVVGVPAESSGTAVTLTFGATDRNQAYDSIALG